MAEKKNKPLRSRLTYQEKQRLDKFTQEAVPRPWLNTVDAARRYVSSAAIREYIDIVRDRRRLNSVGEGRKLKPNTATELGAPASSNVAERAKATGKKAIGNLRNAKRRRR